MGALNAAPNRDPFAVECKLHYGTFHANDKQTPPNQTGTNAIIDAAPSRSL